MVIVVAELGVLAVVSVFVLEAAGAQLAAVVVAVAGVLAVVADLTLGTGVPSSPRWRWRWSS